MGVGEERRQVLSLRLLTLIHKALQRSSARFPYCGIKISVQGATQAPFPSSQSYHRARTHLLDDMRLPSRFVAKATVTVVGLFFPREPCGRRPGAGRGARAACRRFAIEPIYIQSFLASLPCTDARIHTDQSPYRTT